ncbi:DUF5329 domain-containing protein [Thalassotalea loyana]|nr:DUF5329 domain-containing protein [Thalassotalea loyana]
MIRVLLFVFGALCSQVVFAEEKEIASQEIEYLISTVEKSGCRFHRNGDSHDATRAADHLRLKLRRGKKYADSAEHFIERLASKSSWTGKAYHLECQPGQLVEVETWMLDKLSVYRARSHK